MKAAVCLRFFGLRLGVVAQSLYFVLVLIDKRLQAVARGGDEQRVVQETNAGRRLPAFGGVDSSRRQFAQIGRRYFQGGATLRNRRRTDLQPRMLAQTVRAKSTFFHFLMRRTGREKKEEEENTCFNHRYTISPRLRDVW